MQKVHMEDMTQENGHALFSSAQNCFGLHTSVHPQEAKMTTKKQRTGLAASEHYRRIQA
jgi:hypothetical protein